MTKQDLCPSFPASGCYFNQEFMNPEKAGTAFLQTIS